MKQQALELYAFHTEKSTKTVAILTALLEGNMSQTGISNLHGVTRQYVSNIKKKYIKEAV